MDDERFSDDVSEVLAHARAHALALGHPAIWPAHLLLGLLSVEGCPASQALRRLGVTEEQAVRVVADEAGDVWRPPVGSIEFSPRATRVLDGLLATREDVNAPLDTPRLLLGLSSADGAMMGILEQLGVENLDLWVELRRLGADVTPPIPGNLSRWRPSPVEAGQVLSWRARPLALAAVEAAALARSAFDENRTGGRSALEMEVLARLALELGEQTEVDVGADVRLMATAMGCPPRKFKAALTSLHAAKFVLYPCGQDNDQVAILPAGVAWVQAWVTKVGPLFGDWPPDHPGVDDAVA